MYLFKQRQDNYNNEYLFDFTHKTQVFSLAIDRVNA